MAIYKKPVVLDGAKHTPLAESELLSPASIPVAEDASNILKQGETGLSVHPEDAVSKADGNLLSAVDGKLVVKAPEPQLVVSKDEGNYLREGADKGAYLDGNDVLSNGDSVNLLRIDATDGKVILTAEDIQKAGGLVTLADPQTVTGEKRFTGGLYATTPETATPADDTVLTYGWLKQHLNDLFRTQFGDIMQDLIAQGSALYVTREEFQAKLNVRIVSHDKDNLLGLGTDHGAYMNGDLNEGPDSDAVRSASKG